MAKEENGVWRTVGGRRIFIKEGQDLATAMKESGKFEKKYKNKQEVNKRIKEINKKIYSENGVNKEEYDKLKKELDELKKIKKDLPDVKEIEIEEKVNKVLNGDYGELKEELKDKLYNVEDYENDYGIEQSYIDEIETDIQNKIEQLHEDGQISDLEYENFIDNYNEQLCDIMDEKGYDFYEHQGKIYYSMIPKAKKAYDEILKELDKRQVNYKISRSWDTGELPSIYVENDDNETFRIANHYNSRNQRFEAYSTEENKIYSTREYINYSDTILKDLDKFLESAKI